MHGDLVKGVFYGDANPGVEITVYPMGSATARTIQSNEWLVIDHYQIVSAGAASVHFFIGADVTPADPETIARGDVAANGGMVGDYHATPNSGIRGGKPWIVSDVDDNVAVVFVGRITQV